VRSWTPKAGPIQGYLITHNESISIADYLTVEKDGEAVYRPTVHYAYHPCDDTILSLHELQGRNMRAQSRVRLMNDEIVDGMDELGVLLYGHVRNAFWYGSQLTIHETRALAPYQNATGLQVTSAVVAGMIWRSRIRAAAWSTPTNSITTASCRSRIRTSASWSAPTPTGRRWTIAARACSGRH